MFNNLNARWLWRYSYASLATVRVMVSFYPVVTDDTCSYSATENLGDRLKEIQCSAKGRRAQRPVQLREDLW